MSSFLLAIYYFFEVETRRVPKQQCCKEKSIYFKVLHFYDVFIIAKIAKQDRFPKNENSHF